MIKSYQVVRIDEPDFGCEGRPEGYVPMDQVYLIDDSGEQKMIAVPDATLYQLGIDEGDRVSIDANLKIQKIKK